MPSGMNCPAVERITCCFCCSAAGCMRQLAVAAWTQQLLLSGRATGLHFVADSIMYGLLCSRGTLKVAYPSFTSAYAADLDKVCAHMESMAQLPQYRALRTVKVTHLVHQFGHVCFIGVCG